MKNVVVDYLSRLNFENRTMTITLIWDTFPDEQLSKALALPWYAEIVNYLEIGETLAQWFSQDKTKFLTIASDFYFEDPYLFKYCVDQVVRRCVSNEDISRILASCHSEACGGAFFISKDCSKVFSSGFY